MKADILILQPTDTCNFELFEVGGLQIQGSTWPIKAKVLTMLKMWS